MSIEQEELNMRMVNQYLYHDNNTGFHEWLPNTPQHIKDLYVIVYGHKPYERPIKTWLDTWQTIF